VSRAETLLRRRIDRAAVTALRAEVRRELMACGLDGRRLGDFLLAVNEIVANAVVHGDGSRWLDLRREEDRLVCEVSDQGSGIDHAHTRAPPPGPLALRGRGLWLARTLTDSLTITNRPDATVVRLTVRCGPHPDPARADAPR